MSCLAPPPNLPFVLQIENTPTAQGKEGLLVNEHLKNISKHWNAQTDPLNEREEEDLIPVEDLIYNPVPPEQSFHVKVHYILRGKGTPPAFDYDLD